jgi:hypothetical protein
MEISHQMIRAHGSNSNCLLTAGAPAAVPDQVIMPCDLLLLLVAYAERFLWSYILHFIEKIVWLPLSSLHANTISTPPSHIHVSANR